MNGEYDVMMGDKPMGKALVERKGLYYHIRIRCALSGDVLYKVLCRCDGREENLGLLIPMDGTFGLETRKSVKSIGEGDLRFTMLPRHSALGSVFVPLAPEEPFAYITRLKNSFLERQGSTLGIVIEEPGRE